jgi:hypothetical protein
VQPGLGAERLTGMRTRGAAAVLAGLAAVFVLHVGGAAPAHACSCVGGRTVAQDAAGADAVFVGRVAAARRSGRKVTYTVAVETVVKGDVAARQAVHSAADGAACGATLTTGGWYLVFADSQEDGSLETALCFGNRDVAAHYVPGFGAVAAPRPGSAGDVGDGSSGPGWPLTVAVAAALAAAAGVVVSRRRS